MSELQLGKLESTHGIAPAFLQRAVIVAVLSFLFFMAMMLGFYIRQNIGYFLLASAFLLVYVLTMFGWLMMRKYNVKIYENGITYKKFKAFWSEIENVETKTSGSKINLEIRKKGGETMNLSEAIDGIQHIIKRVNERVK
ncbi:MAG TPA: hypothetical protein PKY59_27140 [Pyrinomonadaceae bacterium]|nr:hypothetical protein [Pyrinomonadaceae bacterium]